MDETTVALQPALDTLTTAYDRVLRQRNRLLKEHEGRGAPAGLEAWDEQLVDTGAAVIRARAGAVRAIAPAASGVFAGITGYDLEVRYLGNVEAADDIEASFRARLQERRADELQRRTSLVGPHRDDLELAVRDLGARGFASHGETWVAALSLRAGTASAVEDALGEPPVLLVDDPYSALDPTRRDRVASLLAGRRGQVVVSVADEADIPPQATAIWDIRSGSLAPRKAA
jgi:DNA replication and repair protein RecF